MSNTSSTPSLPCLLTWSVVDWIDVFVVDCYRKVIPDSLRFCQRVKGLRVHAWVVMTNEVQIVASAPADKALWTIVRDSKAFTSAEVHRTLRMLEPNPVRQRWLAERLVREGLRNPANWDFQLWQQINRVEELASAEAVRRALDDVHHRPVRDGYVGQAEHWRWSSAVDYAGGKGLLDIEQLM